MQQADIDRAKELCLEAQGTMIRVMRVQGLDGGRPNHNHGRFGNHDVPRTDLWFSTYGEAPNPPDWLDSSSLFGDFLKSRGVGTNQWNCACLPHQYYTWWGDADEWRSRNKLIVWELDVGDLIALNQQVLVPKRANRTAIAVFI